MANDSHLERTLRRVNEAWLCIALVLGAGSPAMAIIGTGWTEYFPKWKMDVPPNASKYGERYTYENGVFHMWVKDTDSSTYPGRDSGPRSEVRVINEYSTGETQFQASMKLVQGSDKVGIWQVFQRPAPWMVRVYGNRFYQYGNGSSFADIPWGEWILVNIIHQTQTRNLQIYFDGNLVLNTTISVSDGTVDWYNKFGVYGREGMGAMNEIFFKDVRFFKKSAISVAPRPISRSQGVGTGRGASFSALGRSLPSPSWPGLSTMPFWKDAEPTR